MTTLRQSITDWAKRWSTRTQAEFRAIRRYPRDVRFRIFQTADESACLEIYQSLKAGFPPNGTDNFLASLRHRDSAIVVAEREGVIIGMGGISMSGENTATLWYGLVSPAYQGSGIGTALTLFRLCTLPSDEFGVMIYTLRKSQGFYAKLGFQSWFEWDDKDGHKHPAALLDLAGFRRDFVLDALRDRGVVLDGTLVPRPPRMKFALIGFYTPTGAIISRIVRRSPWKAKIEYRRSACPLRTPDLLTSSRPSPDPKSSRSHFAAKSPDGPVPWRTRRTRS